MSVATEPAFASPRARPDAPGGERLGVRAWLRTGGPAVVALLVLGMAALCALLLAWPGQTVTTLYVNDLFIFLDGAHRIASGQVPSRDFHTALGPLAFYLPAAGLWLSGTFGGTMPAGMALTVLGLAVPAAHIIGSRLRPVIALPTAAYLLLIAALPANLGESLEALSFAMFYNRLGWAALGLLLILYLPPRQPRPWQVPADALCAAGLVLFMLYLKASYGVVGLGFLAFMLLDPGQRRWAAWALGLVLASGLAIEAVWRGTAAHVQDLLLAGRVSGGLGTLGKTADVLFRNLADAVLFALFAALALWRRRSLRDLLFFSLCAAAGFLLIRQNYQIWGVITFGAGAAVAAEALLRAETSADGRGRSLAAGAPLLLMALILPVTVHNALTLGLHAGLAATSRGEAVPLRGFERVRLTKLWTEGSYPYFRRYLASLRDGGEALAGLDPQPGRVLVLDFANPFSAGLGLAPPRGDSAWHHWDRTLNADHYLPAEDLFRDVRIVMDPKWPIEHWTADGLRRLYADYLAQHYELKQETADWKVYVARRQPSEALSRLPTDPAQPSAHRSSPAGCGAAQPAAGQPRG